MYKILFIDEQQEDIELFLDYVDVTNSTKTVDIIPMFPLRTLEEMTEKIIQINPDAIVTDYMLNEHKKQITYPVPYTGADLVQHFLSIKTGFPCFVMTSFDKDAISDSDDVNIVYIKDILNKSIKENAEKEGVEFIDKVQEQIKKYKAKISKAEKRLLQLIEKGNSGESLSLSEEVEILDLDKFLETSIDNRHSIPSRYKEITNTDKLDNILSRVDLLLNKIDSKNE